MPEICLRGLNLHYRDLKPDSANGETVMLMHGLGNTGLDWEFQWPALLDAGYRLVCPDFHGFGESASFASAPPLTAERLGPLSFAKDIWALLDELRVERCHLVGYSMGGAVAYQMAVEQPERLISLGILCSLPCFVPQRLVDHWQFWMRHMVSRVMGMDKLARKVSDALFVGQPELIQRMYPRYANNDSQVYAHMLSALAQWDVREALHKISCPVGIMMAEQDYFRIGDVCEAIRNVPHASLEIVPGARHGLPMQMPHRVNQYLLSLFSRSSADCNVRA